MIALSVLAASACAAGGASGAPGLSGVVEIDGSSTVYPITQATAEEFHLEHGDVQISLGVSGTGGGFERFVKGEIDINGASRPIKESEAQAARANGINYIELTVALDGITVAVNTRNEFVDCLTAEELRRIWEPGSDIERWEQIRPSFPDEEITLYGPDTDSGTFDYFTEAVMGEEDASRSDYTASASDDVLVLGVAGDRSALGYFGFAYYTENAQIVKALGIDDGEGCVLPTEETIADRTYSPLSRPLFIYVNTESLKKPAVVEFMKFYLQNASVLAPAVGYVALPDERYAEQLADLQQVIADGS